MSTKGIADLLFAAHPRIVGDEARRTARLFASLMLAHAAVAVLAVLAVQMFVAQTFGSSIWGDLDFYVVAAGLALILVAYLLLRLGLLRIAVILYVTVSAAVALLAPFMPNANAEIGILTTSLIPIILAATAFGRWGTVLVFVGVVAVGALQLAIQPIPDVKEGTGIAILIGVAVSGLLVLVFRAHLATLEKGRQDALRSALEDARSSEDRYRRLFETVVDGIFIADRRGRIVEANRVACTQLGYTREELLGLTLEAIVPSPSQIQATMERVTREGVVFFETEHRSRDGRMIPVELAVSAIEYQGGRAFMGVSRDLSERLRAQGEQRRLESQLQQAAKMESIGRLAGGVAHDFNNLLTAIMGNLEIAVEEAPVDSPVRNLLREARRAARSAADLTGKLLMFSRKQSFEPRHLLLSELLERLRGALQRMVGEDVHIALTAAPDLWEIAADPSLIEQVIVNLAANARDAMPRGGRLGFSALNVRLVADDPAGAPGVPPGEFVLLSVADTGVGISNEVKAHLFEPFFTTKEVGKGTGLGLATSYGAVTRSGGHISVDSSPGRGTTFRLWFPRAASGDERRRPSSPSYLRGGTETVLLVDDAPDVREIAARMLTRLGYSVLTADRVESALDVARATPPPLHLLLTDIVMPGGSGRELADRLAEIHPETRVLLTSGYDQEAVGRREALAPGAPFIAKPYSMAELGEKIRAVLEAPSTYGAVAGT